MRRPPAALLVALLAGCTSSGGGRSVSGPLPPGASPHRAAVAPAKVAVRGDVTGDGTADFVVAAKRRTTVYVLPGEGGRTGIADWSGDGRAGVIDPISELAAADFNGDGRADVALGTPNHHGPDGRAGGGRVTVLYGMPVVPYLDTRRPVILDEDHPSLLHPGDRRPRSGGRFGGALAAGDFNGDGYPDLAVGASTAPGALLNNEPRDPNAGKGALIAFYGGPRGLTTDGAQPFVPGRYGMPAGRIGDLGAGDVTGDGKDDLVIGDSASTRPGDPTTDRCVDPEGDEAGQDRPVGMVHLLRGSPAGLTVAGAQTVSGLDVGIEDGFGHYLAVDRFRGGPYADLVVYGTTRRRGRCDEGPLLQLRGGSAGLDTRHVRSASRTPAFTCCGGLATGDADHDGRADLLVPDMPYDDGRPMAWFFPSGADGLFDRSLRVTAASLGLPPGNWDTIESALLDIDGDGRAELLAGVRYIKGGTAPDEIHLLSARLTAGGSDAVRDLTGRLRDVGGEGPGGEFIR